MRIFGTAHAICHGFQGISMFNNNVMNLANPWCTPIFWLHVTEPYPSYNFASLFHEKESGIVTSCGEVSTIGEVSNWRNSPQSLRFAFPLRDVILVTAMYVHQILLCRLNLELLTLSYLRSKRSQLANKMNKRKRVFILGVTNR